MRKRMDGRRRMDGRANGEVCVISSESTTAG